MKATVLIASLVLLTMNVDSHAQTVVTETVDISIDSSPPLALDSQGNPHTCYIDTVGLFKYARKIDGTWLIEVVEASPNYVGEFSSIAVDAAGTVHVSYWDNTNADLRYANKSGGLWTRELVDGGSVAFSSIAVDGAGFPRIAYKSSSGMMYASKSGGGWLLEIADGASDVGGYPELALDGSDRPHLVYEGAITPGVKHAFKSGGVWTAERVVNTPGLGSPLPSIAVDAAGNPHVAHRNLALDAVYARKSGGVWVSETIRATPGLIDGGLASIRMDSAGNPHVVHLGQSPNKVFYARKLGGRWLVETLDSNPAAPAALQLDAADHAHVTCVGSLGEVKYTYMPSIVVDAPQAGTSWAVGSRQRIAWFTTGGLGFGDCDVFLSVDGGNTFSQLREDVRVPDVSIVVPHTPGRYAMIKIVRESPFIEATMDSFFTIDATITLAKFEAARSDDGTHLTWETRPGPEADIRYRVERSIGGSFSTVADALDRGEFVDPSALAASRYRLIAINGLGEEYVLGETRVTGALAAARDIVAYPNPASGPIEILYRVPVEREVDLAVYDTSGRRIRSLSASRVPVGVQTASWDRRDEAGRDVAAGIYFLRLRVGNGHEAAERVTIVR